MEAAGIEKSNAESIKTLVRQRLSTKPVQILQFPPSDLILSRLSDPILSYAVEAHGRHTDSVR